MQYFTSIMKSRTEARIFVKCVESNLRVESKGMPTVIAILNICVPLLLSFLIKILFLDMCMMYPTLQHCIILAFRFATYMSTKVHIRLYVSFSSTRY